VAGKTTPATKSSSSLRTSWYRKNKLRYYKSSIKFFVAYCYYSALILVRENGFEPVEMNASDARNKKSLEEHVKEMVGNR
jgi:hypothetical protein